MICMESWYEDTSCLVCQYHDNDQMKGKRERTFLARDSVARTNWTIEEGVNPIHDNSTKPSRIIKGVLSEVVVVAFDDRADEIAS